ncbi:MAG: Nif3-like dinuclear metal center hexameric protein [Pseudomonadota bacterium]
MELTTQGFLELVDGIAPFFLAEPWDNCGLQAGNRAWPVRRILVALDVSMEVLEAALRLKADLVLTHHPLMIHPEKSIDFSIMPGAAVAFSATNRISLVSAHTNIDKVNPGLNDYFAARIGLTVTGPLIHGVAKDGENTSMGFGRVGSLERTVSLRSLAADLKQCLRSGNVRLVGDPDRFVNKAAVCTGSGASLIPDFLRTGAQVFITGDIKYHDARDVELAGLGLIDVGHFASEALVVDFFSEVLGQAASTAGHRLEIFKFDREKDPFVSI